MPIENVDAVLKELDEEIAAAGEEEPLVADDGVADEPVKREDDEVAGDGKEEDPEEELAAAVHSDDPKKRNGVFGKFRKENKELKAELDKARADQAANERVFAERLARLEGRSEALTPKQEAAAENKEPDSILYPDEHNAWQIRQMRKENDELRKTVLGVSQFQQETAKERAVADLEAGYRASNPKESYDDAVKFLWDKEKANIKVLRPSLTDSQIDVQIKADKVRLFEQLFNQGMSPPAALLQLAKNAGWKAGEVAVDKKPNLQKLAENQRKSSNLIGGSPASKGGASSDDVLNMSFKKAMLVAHRNPSAFDGEYGDS